MKKTQDTDTNAKVVGNTLNLTHLHKWRQMLYLIMLLRKKVRSDGEHKCKGCKYQGEHQEMMFRPFGVCMRETNLIQAEKNYNADVCPYKDMRKENESR